jgi:probable HAF family extracellular repeat protein
MIALPPLAGGSNSSAATANNNRRIAGLSEYGVTSPTCAQGQVFLYQGVVWGLNASGAPVIERTLPPFIGDTVSAAIGINDAGMIVGVSGACGPPFSGISSAHAVLWKDGSSPRVLGSLGGVQNNFPQVVNNQGWVVGGSDIPEDITQHAFLWQERTGMKDLGLLSRDDTYSLCAIRQQSRRSGRLVVWAGRADK